MQKPQGNSKRESDSNKIYKEKDFQWRIYFHQSKSCRYIEIHSSS